MIVFNLFCLFTVSNLFHVNDTPFSLNRFGRVLGIFLLIFISLYQKGTETPLNSAPFKERLTQYELNMSLNIL